MENSMDFHLSNYYQSLQSIERRLSSKFSHQLSSSFLPRSYLPPNPDFSRKKNNSNFNAFSKKSHFDSNSISKASTEIRMIEHRKDKFLDENITRSEVKKVEITNEKERKKYQKDDSREQRNKIILQVEGYEVGREPGKNRYASLHKEADINLERLLQKCSQNGSKKSEINDQQSKIQLREQMEQFGLQIERSGEENEDRKTNLITQSLILQLKKRDRVFKMVETFCLNKALISVSDFEAIWSSYLKRKAIVTKIQNRN